MGKTFEALTSPFVRATLTVQPDPSVAATYAVLAAAYQEREEAYLRALELNLQR